MALVRALRRASAKSFQWRSLAPTASPFSCEGVDSPAVWKQCRGMASMPTIPESANPAVKKAMKQLFAINWYEIDDETEGLVESALGAGKGGDVTALENSWSAALAVEKFYGTLEALRKGIDDLMGLSGERTGPLPEKHQKALEAAHSKYVKYLSSFAEEELFLKKKVELELGSVMVLLKQRVAGLPPKWGDVGLLGTSGLSGSYIEHRA